MIEQFGFTFHDKAESAGRTIFIFPERSSHIEQSQLDYRLTSWMIKIIMKMKPYLHNFLEGTKTRVLNFNSFVKQKPK
jgi:hypothetical protein